MKGSFAVPDPSVGGSLIGSFAACALAASAAAVSISLPYDRILGGSCLTFSNSVLLLRELNGVKFDAVAMVS